MRFGYKQEDMNSIWATIRSSLVQKVSDIKKHNRQSQKLKPDQQTTTSPYLAENKSIDDHSRVIQDITFDD